MTHSKFSLICLGLSVFLGLEGCAPIVQAEKQINLIASEAESIRFKNTSEATTLAVVRTTKPRLAGEEVTVRAIDTLPAVLLKPLTYTTTGAQTISEVLQSLSQIFGISIRAGEIVQTNTNQPGVGQPVGVLSGKVQLEYINRPAKGLLDEIAAVNDVSWRYVARSNTIEFYRYESRTLSVYLPQGAKNISASISLSGVGGGGSSGGGGGGSGGGGGGSGGGSGGGGSGGGSGGAGNVSVSQELKIDPWSSIMSGVNSILSEGDSAPAKASTGSGAASIGAATGPAVATGKAGRATANPELGIITVTARPEALARVASYIDSINFRFAQNVLVDIKIYNLTMSQQASMGFSLNALYNKLGSYGAAVVAPTLLQPSSGTPGQLTITSTNGGPIDGSKLIAQALNQFGDVALQTQGQVLAVNGQPSPIQVANEINYLGSRSTTQTANVGSTSTLTPGSRVVGFTANFLPLILGDNRILLQYQMQISQLTALTQVGTGADSIQTPQISSQSLQQQAFVRDGQSIVLFGFDQNRDSADTAAGIGGMSKAGGSARQMIVIVLTVNGGKKDA